MLFRNIILSLVFVFSLVHHVKGQVIKHFPKYNFQIETRAHYAIFLQHHFEMERFNSHFPAFEVNLQRATFGNQRWEALYRYPIIGLTAYYSPLGNNKEIGEVFAILPFINFPLNHDLKNSLNFRLGFGLGWLTNKFDPIENYKNFAIGSHLNAAVSLYFEYRLQLSKRFTWISGAGLTHFSNGSMKTPNFGLNLLTVSTGFAWFIKNPNPYLDKKLRPELYRFEFDGKKWITSEFLFSVGLKDMSQDYGEKFFVYNLTWNTMKQVSLRSKIGMGFDLTYDRSDRAVLKMRQSPYNSDWQLLKPGANFAYEMLLDKTSFLFNLGFHLAGKERSEGELYQKLAVKQHFSENVFGVITLTAHYGRADYIGFGLGYRLNFKYNAL
ncbi:MAG: acyloxyacyl hydrolase [Bacteroidales bacterium]|nr:acyloxyacyl hydrolase [Bacteroidales bacterium]